MKIAKNISIPGKHEKDILIDLFYTVNGTRKDVVIFCHGYKGYKDWGAWNQVAEEFALNNFFFVKMNFSHNGGTPEQPIDFPDLEAFGNNNYLKELDDLETVLDWLFAEQSLNSEINLKKVNLIGHSRGGGIVLIKASEDIRISKVVSWAGVSDFGSRFPKGEILDAWKTKGIAHVHNARTKQEMPHYFQFFTSFKENEDRLTIRTAVSKLKIPYLIVHGDEDETVDIKEAQSLQSWSDQASLIAIKGANHSFGSSQPWQEDKLPKDLATAVLKSVEFLK